MTIKSLIYDPGRKTAAQFVEIFVTFLALGFEYVWGTGPYSTQRPCLSTRMVARMSACTMEMVDFVHIMRLRKGSVRGLWSWLKRGSRTLGTLSRK